MKIDIPNRARMPITIRKEDNKKLAGAAHTSCIKQRESVIKKS